MICEKNYLRVLFRSLQPFGCYTTANVQRVWRSWYNVYGDCDTMCMTFVVQQRLQQKETDFQT